MNTLKYLEPLVMALRKGDTSDPYQPMNEARMIVNGLVYLSEIPDRTTHVQVAGYTEIYSGVPTATQFIVNYGNGAIQFNASESGKTLNFIYQGRGIIQYPAERIVAHRAGQPDVVENLQEMIDRGQGALSALDSLDAKITETNTAISSANTATTNANTATTNANTAASNLSYQGVWSAIVAYKKNNSVLSGNTIYTCISDASAGIALTNTTYWQVGLSTQTAIDNATTATTNANNATASANTAATNANTAKSNADTATSNANIATSSANTATTNANTATTNANNATASANTAATNSSFKGAWSSGTAYKKNNSVLSGNTLYVCIADAIAGTVVTNTTYWQVGVSTQTAIDNAVTATTNANNATTAANTATGSANTAATNANSAATAANTSTTNANTATTNANTAATNANTAADNLVNKGDYNSATTYVNRNIVTYNGSSYMCISVGNITNIAPTDTTNWKSIALKGLDGTGSGTVTSVSSANSDIGVATGTNTPVLTLNVGDGANQIVKRNPAGKITTPNFSGNATFDNDVIINGNLRYAGSVETVNSTSLNVADSEIRLNAGATGTPVLDASIIVERGSSADVSIRWKEGSVKWQLTNDGTTYYNIITEGDVATTGANLIVRRDGTGKITGDITGNAATATSATNATNADAVGGQSLTNLDGRYAAASHNHTNATQSASGFMSLADKIKIDGISTNANKAASSTTNGNIMIDSVETIVYRHPTGDGNLHVPINGTTNNNKVLKSGASAGTIAWGSVDWAELVNKPATFSPSTHTHVIADVTLLQTTLDDGEAHRVMSY